MVTSKFSTYGVVHVSAARPTVFLITFRIFKVGHFEGLSFQRLNATFLLMNSSSNSY